MNPFSKILESWSNYELIMVLSTMGLITIVGIVSVKIFTKDRRSVLLALTSSLTTNLLIALTLFSTNLLKIDLSDNYSLVFLLTTTLSMMNIATLNSYLVRNRQNKNFDIDFVTRDHFTDSLKLISFICLFSSILIAFTNGDIKNILIASSISSILSIAINHLLARLFFKDKGSEK